MPPLEPPLLVGLLVGLVLNGVQHPDESVDITLVAASNCGYASLKDQKSRSP